MSGSTKIVAVLVTCIYIFSDISGVLRSSTVLFRSSDSSGIVNVMIDISDLNPGDAVKLELVYDGPSERVDVGGGSTSNTISISIG